MNKGSPEQQTAKKEDEHILVADGVPQLSPMHCPAHSTVGSPGSPLLWKGAADGKVYVKGDIVVVDEPRRLEYTVIDPNNLAVPDIPSNYLTMIYEIKEQGEGLVFELTQGDYSKVAEGQKRYEDTLNGDDFILVKIKELAEGLRVTAS